MVRESLLGRPMDESTMPPLRVPNLDDWVQSVKDQLPVFGMLNAFVSPEVFGPAQAARLRFDPLDLVDPSRPSEEGVLGASRSLLLDAGVSGRSSGGHVGPLDGRRVGFAGAQRKL